MRVSEPLELRIKDVDVATGRLVVQEARRADKETGS